MRITPSGVAAWAVLLSILFVPGVAAAQGPASYHPTGGGHGIMSGYSSTWSGYAVSSSQGAVSSVRGSWLVPAVSSCNRSLSGVSVWVGMDGLKSGTVEQVGTDSYCDRGFQVYYAWYEAYPAPSVVSMKVRVTAGDTVLGAVTYLGSQQFRFELTDLNTGHGFSKTLTLPNVQRSSAEWIVEDPMTLNHPVPLAAFGGAQLGEDFDGVQGTNVATVSGASGPIGSFGSSVVPITMVSPAGATLASPGPLSADGTSFSVSQASQS